MKEVYVDALQRRKGLYENDWDGVEQLNILFHFLKETIVLPSIIHI